MDYIGKKNTYNLQDSMSVYQQQVTIVMTYDQTCNNNNNIWPQATIIMTYDQTCNNNNDIWPQATIIMTYDPTGNNNHDIWPNRQL